MKKESTVPERIEAKHVGMKVLFRMTNNAMPFEGIIDELSPEGEYVKIGRRWIENNGQWILSVLSGPQKRRAAL